MYEKALALDPQYAEAYALLGWTYWHGVDLALESRTPRPWSARWRWRNRPLPWMTPCPTAHSLLAMSMRQKQQYDQAIAEGNGLSPSIPTMRTAMQCRRRC